MPSTLLYHQAMPQGRGLNPGRALPVGKRLTQRIHAFRVNDFNAQHQTLAADFRNTWMVLP